MYSDIKRWCKYWCHSCVYTPISKKMVKIDLLESASMGDLSDKGILTHARCDVCKMNLYKLTTPGKNTILSYEQFEYWNSK